MAMDTHTYRAHEFADLGRAQASGFKLKVIAEHSEESRSTKWLNISAEELETIIQLLIKREG